MAAVKLVFVRRIVSSSFRAAVIGDSLETKAVLSTRASAWRFLPSGTTGSCAYGEKAAEMFSDGRLVDASLACMKVGRDQGPCLASACHNQNLILRRTTVTSCRNAAEDCQFLA